ncbi:hypothetical protein J4N45_10480 [Vibrio sp. SCSIO 43140]|uniref:hypothetical protein n=1 Tax=Vibrio sp. SCSIO 43140 TaxID=2819100 RepID=UPI002074D7D7|nr:hypothetical protein [Vibrio sp. SCSIO 43140]USD58956.1 hypothetical protein J4N45_10480 [Vibrio sp. SCSIO 43140]
MSERKVNLWVLKNDNWQQVNVNSMTLSEGEDLKRDYERSGISFKDIELRDAGETLMEKLHVKCTCGRDEKLTEQQADDLPWQESEKVNCHCGKALPHKGHGKVGNFGTAWVSE